jgi:hypothetical protein
MTVLPQGFGGGDTVLTQSEFRLQRTGINAHRVIAQRVNGWSASGGATQMLSVVLEVWIDQIDAGEAFMLAPHRAGATPSDRGVWSATVAIG